MPDLFKEVEEKITWQLCFANGAICTSSRPSNCHIDRFYAAADEGYFKLSPALSYRHFKGKTSQGIFNFPIINLQAAMIDGIAGYFLSGKFLPVHTLGEEGRKNMKIVEGIYSQYLLKSGFDVQNYPFSRARSMALSMHK